jgi:hypothetical protein
MTHATYCQAIDNIAEDMQEASVHTPRTAVTRTQMCDQVRSPFPPHDTRANTAPTSYNCCNITCFLLSHL